MARRIFLEEYHNDARLLRTTLKKCINRLSNQPFPHDTFLESSWKELYDAIDMGMESDIEIAEILFEWLNKNQTEETEPIYKELNFVLSKINKEPSLTESEEITDKDFKDGVHLRVGDTIAGKEPGTGKPYTLKIKDIFIETNPFGIDAYINYVGKWEEDGTPFSSNSTSLLNFYKMISGKK